jgi:hypothetical protein
MKEAFILSPDKETSERLTTLINLLFPEVRVSCASDGLDDPEKFRIDPPPGKAATSGQRVGTGEEAKLRRGPPSRSNAERNRR